MALSGAAFGAVLSDDGSIANSTRVGDASGNISWSVELPRGGAASTNISVQLAATTDGSATDLIIALLNDDEGCTLTAFSGADGSVIWTQLPVTGGAQPSSRISITGDGAQIVHVTGSSGLALYSARDGALTRRAAAPLW